MTTRQIQETVPAPALGFTPSVRTGPVLVACDGTPGADGALRAARLLAQQTGATIEVYAVLDPMPVVAPEIGVVPWTADLEASRKAALLRGVRDRMAVVGEPTWNLELGTGDPATLIAQRAFERRASLILLGLGHHAMVDRLLGSELALRVMRVARQPVLAVPAKLETLPRRTLVAMDFSPQSVRAAQLALEVLPETEALYIAHVTPRSAMEQAMAGFTAAYRQEVDAALDRVRERLETRVPIETVTLSGDPARTLLGFAQVTGIGLIAMGTQGLGFVHRMLAGSVATRVVRGAECAVLVVPSRATVGFPERIGGGWTVESGSDPVWWTTRLQAFTQENAGRRARLEVDDPTLGAQALLEDYVVRGVAYDPRDGRVELMLAIDGDTAHLTHSISGVTSIDVLRDAQGRDHTLRIVRGDAQTLLTLMR